MIIDKYIKSVMSTIVNIIISIITLSFIKDINKYSRFLPNPILAKITIFFFLYIESIITLTCQNLSIILTFILIIQQILIEILSNIECSSLDLIWIIISYFYLSVKLFNSLLVLSSIVKSSYFSNE